MNFNADLTTRAVVYTPNQPWVNSPLIGVTRRALERIGGESAEWATTIVRYAAGSHFSHHVHDRGEEILVLDGSFSDHSGEFPVGMYVRNPPGSQHRPFSTDGCTILVKLRQFAVDDNQFLRLDTHKSHWQSGDLPGQQTLPLFSRNSEHVELQRWTAKTRLKPHVHPMGEEIYVIEGELTDEHGNYPAGTWLRQPAGSSHTPVSHAGCTLYVKTDHLPLTTNNPGAH